MMISLMVKQNAPGKWSKAHSNSVFFNCTSLGFKRPTCYRPLIQLKAKNSARKQVILQ